MKPNVRQLAPVVAKARRDAGQVRWRYPLGISLVGHVILLVLFVVSPSLKYEKPRSQSVINVSMVSFASSDAGAGAAPAAVAKTPRVEKPAEVPAPTVAVPAPATPPAPAVSPAPAAETPAPQPKTSLKRMTFQSTEVVRQAMERLESKVETDAPTAAAPQAAAPTESLQSTLERLRQTVGRTEVPQAGVGPETGTGGSVGGTGATVGTAGGGRGRTAELIDLYRLEIAFQIQRNWAFNEQLAGGDHSLAAAIVFKVMPDGEIRDIFFTDRSGNAHLDESAYRAIVKSNPVDSHPSGLTQPYVVTALRFTPRGIR